MAIYNVIDHGDEDKKKKASEKVIIKRQFDSVLPVDNKSLFDIAISASKKTGVDADMLAANALQEGLNTMADSKKIKSSNEYRDSKFDKKKYPIDGFLYYGLDNFSSVAPELIKRGYLPSDFDYQPFEAQNENWKTVKTAAFKTNEDALIAKGAFLKLFRDDVRDYAKKIGLPLNKESEDYLTMSAYNGGMGNAKIMIDELATGYNPKVFIKEGKTSRKGVHKNIAPRMERMELFKEVRARKEFPFGFNTSLIGSFYK